LLELLAIASAPSVALFLFFYLRDKYEREPLWLLFRGFWLGAIMVIPAGFIEVLLLGDSLEQPQNLITLFIRVTLGIALIEEALKFLVLRLYLYPKPSFNEPYDGIMYAVIVALGFAFAENVAYILDYGVGVGVVRALLAVPMHALVAVFMGYHLAELSFLRTPGVGSGVASNGAWYPDARPRLLRLAAYHGLVVGVLGSSSGCRFWFYALRAVRQHQAASPFRA
jgi:RsiW-degrading membrane proteinase PrsW (M82 family)